MFCSNILLSKQDFAFDIGHVDDTGACLVLKVPRFLQNRKLGPWLLSMSTRGNRSMLKDGPVLWKFQLNFSHSNQTTPFHNFLHTPTKNALSL